MRLHYAIHCTVKGTDQIQKHRLWPINQDSGREEHATHQRSKVQPAYSCPYCKKQLQFQHLMQKQLSFLETNPWQMGTEVCGSFQIGSLVH